jgi:peptide/nickel transport system substrate-binding protein/oligopeptide transport system substrate-binding protein
LLVLLLLTVLAGCSIGGGDPTAAPSALPSATATTAPASPAASGAPRSAASPALGGTAATPVGAGQVLTPPARTTQPTPRGEQSLTIVAGAQPPVLDPALVRDTTTSFLTHQVFRGLVRLDEQLNPVPDLAERIAISEDGLTYTFTLRGNATFHDGKAIDAAAVKYSLERATDPALAGRDGSRLPGATYLNDILGAPEKLSGQARELRGLRVVDPRTIEIRLDAPKAHFLMKISHPSTSIVDEANVRAGGNTWAQRPNGSGPFRVERLSNGELLLRRFDRFYAGAPPLDRVSVLYGQQAGSPMNLYEAGEIDYTGVPLSSVDRVLVETSPLRAQLTVTPSLSLTYIGFNVTQPPFDDPAVRRAFAQALNRERLVTVSQGGKVVLAEGIVPPTMPGGPWAGGALPYDLAAARASLGNTRYGGAANLPRATIYAAGGGIPVTMRQVYERDLGVALEVIGVDWPEYLAGLSAQAYPAFELSWIADYPDPENFLAVLFGSGSAENHTGYSNPAFDRLLADAAVERDPARRSPLYLEAQRIILADAVIIPCYHSIDYTLVKPHVKGLTITPMGILELDSVWIEK